MTAQNGNQVQGGRGNEGEEMARQTLIGVRQTHTNMRAQKRSRAKQRGRF